MEDIKYRQKMASTVELITNHPDISQDTKDIVQRYADDFKTISGCADATHWKWLSNIKLLLIEEGLDLSVLLKDGDGGFEEADRINKIINEPGRYKWSTRSCKITAIKIFCKFVDYNDDGKLIRRRSKRGAECLDFISPGKKVTTSKTRKNTLLIADIQKIDEAITGSTLVEARTRAHMWFSLDIGNRASEVESIKLEDITWGTIKGEGRIPIKVDVFGKKNEFAEREDLALTIISRSHLAKWLRLHPDKHNPNALLFCPLRGNTEKWGDGNNAAEDLFKFIKDAAKRAGIADAKRVHQTGFRSAMQTYWLDQGVDPVELRKRVGHVPGSTMMETAYRAIDTDSSNEAILRATGEIPEAQQIQFTPPDHCPICKTPTNGLSTYCNACEARFTFNITETEREEIELREYAYQAIVDFKIKDALAKRRMQSATGIFTEPTKQP